MEISRGINSPQPQRMCDLGVVKAGRQGFVERSPLIDQPIATGDGLLKIGHGLAWIGDKRFGFEGRPFAFAVVEAIAGGAGLFGDDEVELGIEPIELDREADRLLDQGGFDDTQRLELIFPLDEGVFDLDFEFRCQVNFGACRA